MRNSNASEFACNCLQLQKDTRISALDISSREVTIKDQTAKKANKARHTVSIKLNLCIYICIERERDVCVYVYIYLSIYLSIYPCVCVCVSHEKIICICYIIYMPRYGLLPAWTLLATLPACHGRKALRACPKAPGSSSCIKVVAITRWWKRHVYPNPMLPRTILPQQGKSCWMLNPALRCFPGPFQFRTSSLDTMPSLAKASASVLSKVFSNSERNTGPFQLKRKAARDDGLAPMIKRVCLQMPQIKKNDKWGFQGMFVCTLPVMILCWVYKGFFLGFDVLSGGGFRGYFDFKVMCQCLVWMRGVIV